MKKLLTDIQSRLKAQVTANKYIDEDWGQLDYFNPKAPVKFPCSIIDVNQVQWQNQARKIQMGLVQISIKICDQKLSNTSGAAPQAQKDKAFGIYDQIEDTHIALQGWSADKSYSPLNRTQMRKSKRDDGVRIFELIYTTELYDDSAELTKEKVTISPSVSKLED